MILDPTTVGTLIGVILITLAGSGIFVIRSKDGWKAKGAADAQSNNVTIKHPVPEVPVHLNGGHVAVSMPEKFLIRSEFLEYKSDIKSDIREMRVLYDKALCLMTDLGESLHKRISENDEIGAERRRRIHEKLNEHSDKLSRIDSRTEVSKSIGKLGSAIMTLAKKD